MKTKWIFILLLFLTFYPVNNTDADWRDNINRFRDNAKNNVERIQNGVKKTKKSWDDDAERRRKIYNSAKKSYHRTTEKSKKLGKSIQSGASRAKKSWDDDVERRREIYNSVKKNYNKTLNRIRDPETRRKATETVSTIVEIRRKIKETKRKGVNAGFDSLAKIPIKGTTLGELASEKLYREFPGLGRTGLFDDPAEAATALVCHDSNFFLSEVPLIQKGGKRMSVYGAIESSSAFNASKTIKYLQIAGATEGIASANNTGDVMIGVFNAIDAANR